MALPTIRRLVLLAACLLGGAPATIAHAVPLTADDVAVVPRAHHGVSDAEVLEGVPTTAEPAQIRYSSDPMAQHSALRGPNNLSGLGAPQELGSFVPDGSSSSFADALRPLLNLNPRANEAGGSSATRRGRRDEQDLVMSGTGLQDFMDEAIRGIVNSAVELRVDDQGRASFSLMGMGDFGIMVSGDRNEVALVSGADVLFTANRNPYPQSGAYVGAAPDHGPSGFAPASRPVDTRDGSPLHQAMELLSEIATHPLSLLVYVIVGAYVLLWNVLTAQRQARPQHAATFVRSDSTSHHHRASRSRRSRRSRRH